MSKKSTRMTNKVRHPSLEMPEADVVKKKLDREALSKNKHRFFSISDILKSNKNLDSDHKKSMAQATLNYLFRKEKNNNNNHHNNYNKTSNNNGTTITNGGVNNKPSSLRKQLSVGSYPIIEISCEDDEEQQNHEDYLSAVGTINRSRPATVCSDKVCGGGRQAEALALERPRKKLSFREPEVISAKNGGLAVEQPLRRSTSFTLGGILLKTPSVDDFTLESQAMRVVRTIGQAFEVCHKLSINAPEPDLDQDEQDTLTQDLVSDNLSDITSDKPKKDFISEGASDRMSLPPDDISSFKDIHNENNNKNNNTRPSPPQLEVLPPPPSNNNTRKSPLTSAETYASPHSDGLTSGNAGSGNGSLPPAGSALSAHHEIQLLREQLEQQSQQTQAAVAQLQLVREQLAAEQSARLEAQARTHQLLVHNRELLDHIAALVAHLQDGEKSSQKPTPPHMTMPQQSQHMGVGDSNYNNGGGMGDIPDNLPTPTLDNNSCVLQALGLNPQGLIENRAVTSCLPSSPLRTSFNPNGAGGIFNLAYPAPPIDTSAFDSQLLQRLQALSGYTPPAPAFPAFNYNHSLSSYLPTAGNLFNQQLLNNNNYALQSPTQKKMPSSLATMRHSYAGAENRNSEPRQIINHQFQNQQFNQQQQQQQQNLTVQQNANTKQQSRQPSPQPESREAQFIKPLSQVGTLTTTDSEGRVRVIVPVPSNSNEDPGNLLANLRITDDLRPLNGPPITRSTSEKVPNRSELMSQVQRTAWARHTTK